MDKQSEKQEKTIQESMAPASADNEHVAISLLEDHEDKKGPAVESFTINPVDQNTAKNPYRETTVTLPHLVKKVPQRDLLPRPYRSFNQVICLTYTSAIFCLFSGLLANRWAWRAKLQNGKGLYTLAKKWARYAVYLSYASFVMGVIIIVSVTLSEVLNPDRDRQ
ncbi:uncharacterized protein [Argopecten irradians]|uniref:uncharacterized protein n=1 Tax=Argopecten irradians TaxID=31199 RepID=UPI003716DBF9